MKNLLIAMVMVLFTLPACDKDDQNLRPENTPATIETDKTLIAGGTPECIKDVIKMIKSQPVRNPNARIYKYLYHGKVVYYVTSYCCDIPSDLYDEQCNIVCHPDGNMIGATDPDCADFFEQRAYEKLVWADDRKY